MNGLPHSGHRRCPGLLTLSLWHSSWHLETSYSVSRQACPDFLCGLMTQVLCMVALSKAHSRP